MYKSISVAEAQHEKRYRALLANIEQGRVFKKDGKVYVAVQQLRVHP